MLMYRTSINSRHIKRCFQNCVRGSEQLTGRINNKFSTLHGLRQSAVAEEAIKFPQSETTPANDKIYLPKITTIVDQISSLNLLEVADLNELLKAKLKISDAPVMMGGGMMQAATASAPAEEEDAEPAAAVQTSFKITIEKFDDTKKVALIKELKAQMEGMNLVQAKKFVESCPAVVKADIPKDEADKLKTALEAAGATCVIV